MIKIYDAKTAFIEWEDLYQEGYISEDYIEKVLKRRNHADRFQYLIRKKGRVIGAASLSDICENKAVYKTFLLNGALFEDVNKYVRAVNIAEGTCFPILNQKGEFMFLVSYLEDKIAGVKRKDFSDYKKRLQNVEKLDFMLIDQYQTFVFLEIEEYSIAIARLLLEQCQDKKVFFLDERIKYFIQDSRIRRLKSLKRAGQLMSMTEEWMTGARLSFLDRVKAFAVWKAIGWLKSKGAYCVIKADRRNHPGDDAVVYNSQNILYSLLWCEKESSYGERHPTEKIFIIDYPCDNDGLVSIVRGTAAHVMAIVQGGGIPVINLNTYPNQYLNSDKENMWEYFFEPVSNVTVHEAYESKRVISAKENKIELVESQINPYQRKNMCNILDIKYSTEFEKYIRVNLDTQMHMDKKIPSEIKKEGYRVLGVVARGTDYKVMNKPWRQEGMFKIDKFIESVNYYKKQINCDYVFLATEDLEYFEMFQGYFGNKLLSIDQKRVTYDYKNKEYKFVKDLLEIEDGVKAGRDYLSIVQALAECNALLYNVECGAVRLARQWNQERYELTLFVTSNLECGG